MDAPISLIDSHAHLDEIDDLEQSLKMARDLGIQAIVAVGVDLASNRKTLKIAKENRGYVYPAIGYHPWDIEEKDIQECLAFIGDHIDDCVAMGEVGLDYKTKVKKDLQRRVFQALLKISYDHKKPVIIHCRYSHQRAYEMIREVGIASAVFHWYTGPIDLLDKIIKNGYFVSATPALTYSPPHQEAIRKAPLERILLETDTPVVYGNHESRPKDVRTTLKEVARIKKIEVEEVAYLTTKNACQFFGITLHLHL
ncbi:MAG TPA: TatD family deoxyribonuclease [Syntrophaceae bacterium]|nr:TatD family deoxyribonuclease [Syntrophaceae bacterium]